MLIEELFDEMYTENGNVLYDVVEMLSQNGIKDENEILWCGTISKKASWEEFKKVAKNSFYSCSWNIDYALIIVGKDWWLERAVEDTDYFYWEFKRYPIEPKETAKFIFDDGYFKVEVK
jgi:hypothetical protein